VSKKFFREGSGGEMVANAISGGSSEIVDMCWPDASTRRVFGRRGPDSKRLDLRDVVDCVYTPPEELQKHVLEPSLSWIPGSTNLAQSRAAARLALEQDLPPTPALLLCMARAPGDPYVERYFAAHFAADASVGRQMLKALEEATAAVSVLAALAAAREARRHGYED
jgi:hypothetical protein